MSNFDWDQLIDYAEQVAARGSTDQAELRAAVSRAYYGAFHAIREALTLHGRRGYQWSKSDKQGSHKHLLDAAKEERVGSLSVAHQMQDARVSADYEPQPGRPARHYTVDDVKEACKRAREVLHATSSWKASQSRR